jgi:hypothetical protein
MIRVGTVGVIAVPVLFGVLAGCNGRAQQPTAAVDQEQRKSSMSGIQQLRKSIQMGTERVFPEGEYRRGVVLGARGDYKGAAEHFRNYLRLAPNSPIAETVRRQLARAEELAAAKPAGGQVAPKSR